MINPQINLSVRVLHLIEMPRKKKRKKAGKVSKNRYRCRDGKTVKIHHGPRGGSYIMQRKKGGGTERRYIG